MLKTMALATFVACSTALLHSQATAQSRDDGRSIAGELIMTTERVASGLARPVFVTAPPGDTERLFIVEQRGSGGQSTRGDIRILRLSDNTLLSTPFLTITGLNTGSEQGLLGLAFHPNYAENGYFYVNYTSSNTTFVRRYQVSAGNPNVANPNSGLTILSFAQPQSNHNGGWIAFGPDGYLYIANGDGGGAGDTSNNAQTMTTRLGKMLRIDVDSATPFAIPPDNPFVGPIPGLDEIWAYGLRNPWRCSFDRATGDLYIADVGQFTWEEISVQPANSTGGENYGWRCYEGNHTFNVSGCPSSQTMVFPIHEYNHSAGRCSITGGYVYRGSEIPEMYGHYFFADYCGGQIYTLEYTGSPNPPVVNRTSELAPGGGLGISSISSFGEDANGELYICDLMGGEVFRIKRRPPQPPANDDCANATAVFDGTYAFTTVAASTDGPNEPASCDANGYSHIENDVWFKYFAPCDGVATVSVCDADFDTKIAAYVNCPAGPGTALACNDNACGSGGSEISFPVTANTLYRIRVGGFEGQTGSGSITLSCGVPSNCPADISGDGAVNVDDLLMVIGNWGPCPGDCPADTNGDDTVNVDDLLTVISAWGPCS